jgi:predicted AlkP superfamily pyrophosphatase or phosphodiesterase
MKAARVILVCAFAATVWSCSRATHSPKDFKPTVILISFDGFRNDYIDKTETPNLHRLTNNGVRAEGMIPAFPSKTFPNHYTIVTGLYPARHGIVANTMFDPEFNALFKISDRNAVSDGRWWDGEPLWVTAEKQGQISATFFWVGSEAEIMGVRPRYWKPYDGKIPNAERVQQALAWLDLPATERPTFITLYFSDTDDAGHDFGPESQEVIESIKAADTLVGQLVQGLEARGLLEKVNLIITSDHGMAATSDERVIKLSDYIDLKTVEIIDGSPAVTLRPKQANVDSLYRVLVHAHSHMKVFRKEDFPKRFHYAGHRRIMPLMCLADDGWSINTRPPESGPRSFNGGNHGYDNLLPSMRATFIAHGPAFKRGLRVAPFQNLHLYHLMAKILKLQPAPNDGSLDSVRVMLR